MAPKAEENVRTAAEERTWLAEVVRDHFVVGDERSQLKALAPDWGPLFWCSAISDGQCCCR